jgi:hypothetical protein
VNPAGTATALSVSPAAPVFGQPVTLTATVAVLTPGAGLPSGTVTFRDVQDGVDRILGTAELSAGTAILGIPGGLAAGSHALTAAYGGDAGHAPSTSAGLTVTVRAAYAFTGFLTPLGTAGTPSSPTSSGSQKYGSAIPIKWQLRDGSGALVSSLSSARLLEAWTNPACAGPPPAGSTRLVLYSPTNGATGGSTFRFGTDTFIFNWDTSSGVAKGCYNVVLSLDDGTQKATIVKLQ